MKKLLIVLTLLTGTIAGAQTLPPLRIYAGANVSPDPITFKLRMTGSGVSCVNSGGYEVCTVTGSSSSTVTTSAPVTGDGSGGNPVTCATCALTTTAISAGTGLSGGGSLAASRTLSIDATVATLTGAQVLTNKTLTTPTIAVVNSPAATDLALNAPTGQAVNININSVNELIVSSIGIKPGNDNTQHNGLTGQKWLDTHSYNYFGYERTISSSGAITVSNVGETVILTATGNISSITLTQPGAPGELIILVLKQDAAGTSTWPTTFVNATLAGGTFSKTTAANAVDTITFRYDIADSKWREVSRSLNQS